MTNGIAVSDFKNLQDLKLKADRDPNKALPEVAKQFEAIFLQSMLRVMRESQHFIDESSPFRGQNEETFQEMLDGQYASSITEGRGISLADVLTKQLQTKEPSENKQALRAINTPKIEAKPIALHKENQVKPIAKEENFNLGTGIDEFVKSIWPLARDAASIIGLDPKILMAQAALETGWGKFVAKDAEGLSSNNLFNIKSTAKSKDSVEIKTTEYIANTPIKTNASFRKYASVEHSFNDYVSLIKGSSRYETALANANDPERFVDELSKAGYATDPQYANKILSIYNGSELEQALVRNGFKGF
ncbi:MAG: flagellar assembly peptidoglycan hydrolase FlgJ [Proteobacteria bacterium]|nr:flagellar assembly peptidoglycan hydrolase FlgJ [Pseudomonadota bacterium]